jgi:hypothetical protein
MEAKNTLGLTNNHLIVLLLEDYPADAYAPLVADDDWATVRYVPTKSDLNRPLARYLRNHRSVRVRGYYDTYQLHELIKLLDKVAMDAQGAEHVFLGNYWREYMRHFGHKMRRSGIFLLDDGTATLGINERRRQDFSGSRRFRLSDLKEKTIDKLIGLKGEQLPSVTYFSVYDLETIPADSVIRNSYQYLRTRAASARKVNEVFFLGMTCIEEGFTDEHYVAHLRQVKKYFEDEDFVYVPHKCEPQDRVERLRQELNLNIRRFDVPIEYQLSVRGVVPKALASFFSSALENCRVIFGSEIAIKAFYVDPRFFPLNPGFVRDVYGYYQTKSSSHFEVVEA